VHVPTNARGERVATYVLRQGEFDRASGKLGNLARSAIWRREVAAEHALLATASRKTMRLDRLAQYHAVAAATAEACWANRSKPRISRAAFGVWSRSTALLDAFWASVRRGRARDGTLHKESCTLLGYGAGWGFTGGGPHRRVRVSADKVFGAARVITVDEFNTTKSCHVCGDELQGVLDRTKNFKRGAPAGAVDRGLKRCARRSCSSFLDRDVNAALNMLKALLADLRSGERPTHLRRDSALQKPGYATFMMHERRPVRLLGSSDPH
jgi:hypothetical protein